MIITSLLDTDLYKFTMAQMAFHQHPQTRVKYSFNNRTKGVSLVQYKDEICKELKSAEDIYITSDEINYLRTLGLFKEDFLSFLSDFKLNYSDVNIFIKNDTLHIEVEGLWTHTILWETVILSVVNEVYFRNNYPNATDSIEPYQRLASKIHLVKEHNSKNEKEIFKFLEFGTRRRYSKDWQHRVLTILKKELPENLIGTSNVNLSRLLGMQVTGTAAHEAYAAFQVVSGLESAHKGLWDAWLSEYGDKLGIVLTDIYTTDAFLKDFTKEYAVKLKGLRHDSGDPLLWLDKVVNHYKNLGINPKEKKYVFSDGLTVEKALAILDYAMINYELDESNVIFGIGTSLTNDFKHKALSIVMKMTECEGLPVVKISDEPSKAIGSKEVIKKIKSLYSIEF